ncbi:SRPBCC family protein [Nakamurella endophytica]|uniref:SRPBCC family protein n=1 Tax=Nakamurella endophytica TaxID=1748367 RepID=A0A917T6R0_9ACTN|nr:SRPBCC family protein [Nakamurella endophytica]GGM12559.1 hypothetical protein GCM10011594_35580 [Nakamurella endophytica]
MRLRLTATGRATPDVAWERYARPALWPTWSPQIVSVDYPAARLVAGTSGTVHGWFGLRLSFTVDEVDVAARTWAWTVRAPLGITLRLHHGVSARPAPSRSGGTGAGAPGSRTELESDGFAPVVLAYAPLAQIALQRLVTP